MPFTDDELVFLRAIAKVDLKDASHDAALTARNRYSGPYFVPDDPEFYVDLMALSKALKFDPIEALIIIASESNFNPDTISAGKEIATSGPLKGRDVMPRGLIGFTKDTVPSIMTPSEWEAMPKMTARQQLPFVAKVLQAASDRTGNRPYGSGIDLYLATAAPAARTQSGRYNLARTMYAGPNWQSNFGLDFGPPLNARGIYAGPSAGEYALHHKETEKYGTTAASRLAYAKDLAEKGIIKGRVTLGDLQRWVERMSLPENRAAWKLASKRFHLATGFIGPENIAFRDESVEDSEPFPDFSAPSENALDGDAMPGSPKEPLPLNAEGAIDFPNQSNFFSSLLPVAAAAAIFGVAYHWTRK